MSKKYFVKIAVATVGVPNKNNDVFTKEQLIKFANIVNKKVNSKAYFENDTLFAEKDVIVNEAQESELVRGRDEGVSMSCGVAPTN